MARDRRIVLHLLIALALNLFVTQTVYFVISFFYLVFVLYKNKFNLYTTCPVGMKIYCLCIVVNVISGMMSGNSVRDIIRDVYYFFPTIIWIIIGSNLVRNKSIDFDSVYRTIYIFGCVCSLAAFFSFIMNGDLSFNGIRTNFTIGVYNVGFIWPYAVYRTFIKRDYAFSKTVDIGILFIMAFQIMLSLGRISMGLPLFGAMLVFILYLYKNNNYYALKRFATFVFLCLVTIAVAIMLIPRETMAFFIDKVLNSLSEIDTDQVINSTELAMNNWRAYENQAAWNAFKHSNLFSQIFGSGLGTGISIQYTPYSWIGMLVDNKLPLLHNGFLTALIKIGLVGMSSLITMFAVPCIQALGRMRSNGDEQHTERCIMIAVISVMGLIFTYVVQGPIRQGPFLMWAFLIGELTSQQALEHVC